MSEMDRPYYLNDPVPKWKKGVVYAGMFFLVAGIGLTAIYGGKAYAGFQSLQAQQEEVKDVASPSSPRLEPETNREEPKKKVKVPFTWDHRPTAGKKVGILSLPKIGVKIPIIEGTRNEDLSRGVGHHRSSVLPGEPDRSVLAGHRETALRHMDQIKPGDSIRIETTDHIFFYEAKNYWITDDDDPRVVASNHEQRSELILYSCYPLDAVYTGYAPKRYVLRAELTKIQKQ